MIVAAGAALLVSGVLIAAAIIGISRHPQGSVYFETQPLMSIGLFVGALGILGLYVGSRLGGWWQRRQNISRIALGLVSIASALS